MKKEKLLEGDEIAEAQILIDHTPPGTYKLKELFGSHWEDIDNPTVYGTKFLATVEKKLLSGIEAGKKTSDNAQTYLVLK